MNKTKRKKKKIKETRIMMEKPMEWKQSFEEEEKNQYFLNDIYT